MNGDRTPSEILAEHGEIDKDTFVIITLDKIVSELKARPCVLHAKKLEEIEKVTVPLAKLQKSAHWFLTIFLSVGIMAVAGIFFKWLYDLIL